MSIKRVFILYKGQNCVKNKGCFWKSLFLALFEIHADEFIKITTQNFILKFDWNILLFNFWRIWRYQCEHFFKTIHHNLNHWVMLFFGKFLCLSKGLDWWNINWFSKVCWIFLASYNWSWIASLLHLKRKFGRISLLI